MENPIGTDLFDEYSHSLGISDILIKNLVCDRSITVLGPFRIAGPIDDVCGRLELLTEIGADKARGSRYEHFPFQIVSLQ
jgi:hypothetical protein